MRKLFKKTKKDPTNTAPPAPAPAQQEPKDLFRSRGDDRAQNGDYTGAAMMYDEALRYAPTDTTLLLSRSFAHAMSTPPKLDLALQDADTIIQHDPTNWQGWLQKGETSLKMGDNKEAEEALVNAVGFAKGPDKFTAQKSLRDARNRAPAVQPSDASVNLTSPTPSSGLSHTAPLPIRTTALNNTLSSAQSPPTVNSTTFTPAIPSTSSTQTPPRSIRRSSSNVQTPLTTNSTTSSANRSPQTSPTSAAVKPTPSNTQIPPTANSTTQTPPPSNTRSPPFMSSTTPRFTQFIPSRTQPSSSTNSVPPVTPSPFTTNQTKNSSGSAPQSTPSSTQTPGASTNTTGQIPPVTRRDDSESQPPVPNLPLRPEDLPPGYTPDLTNPDPTVRALSQQALTTQLTQLQTTLASRNKGSLSIRAYTAAARIDAVKLIYVGMTQLELTSRELGTPTYLHPTFRTMAVDALSFPGNTFLDMDCESSAYYEGKLPGTVTISGYSEEYREHQLLRTPILTLALEGTITPPTMALDKIVDRIRLLQRQNTLEDNVALGEILGLSQLTTLQSGFYSGGSRQRQIEVLCMALTRSLYNAPSRFIDLSKARNITNNALGTGVQGIGLQNFLFQILLGAELLIRLRKEPLTTSYAGLVTDATSALMVLSALWMENVTIQGPRVIGPTPLTPGPTYTLLATQHQLQAEGLIRFGEALSWPYMDEARNYIENAYHDLTSSRKDVGYDICDWLFGLVLPGKIFRHRIMCCLVFASPSVRSFNPAPFWDNGLVIKNKSYWPKRSVLGRVLGGLKNPRSVCGWVGPLPSPDGDFSGWILLNARRVDIPVPVSSTQTSLQSLGFGEINGTESPEEILQNITNPDEWIRGTPPSRPSNDSSRSVFKAIHLAEIPNAAVTAVGATSTTVTSKEYRASLDFEINGSPTRYTLYSNPIFVYAPPCVGTHTMHRRQAQTYLDSVVRVSELKESYMPNDTLMIIDALGEGEEVVARAWCAERARHAVIRRDGECCFACATGVAAGRTGLAYNVLIWSR